MPCDEVARCEHTVYPDYDSTGEHGMDCGQDAITECYFCGPLCKVHKDSPCSGGPIHVGIIHEEEINQGAA